jgi:hypothetical protein
VRHLRQRAGPAGGRDGAGATRPRSHRLTGQGPVARMSTMTSSPGPGISLQAILPPTARRGGDSAGKPAPSSARRPRTDFLGKRGGHLGRHPRQTGTTTTAFCDSGGEGLVATMRAGRSDSGHGGRRLPSDPRPPRDAATRRVSAGILAALSATPGAERPAADLTERAAGELAARLTGRWGAGRRRRSTAPT